MSWLEISQQAVDFLTADDVARLLEQAPCFPQMVRVGQ